MSNSERRSYPQKVTTEAGPIEFRQAAKEAATLEEAQSLTREAQKKFGNVIRTIPTNKVEGTLDELNRQSPNFVHQLKATNQFNQMVRTGSIPGTKLTTQTL